MSWLNESLNSLKGQITNFATEVLAEGIVHPNAEESVPEDSGIVRLQELEKKCSDQEQEISALRKLNDELIVRLHSQKQNEETPTSKKDDVTWFWDPPPSNDDDENIYKNEIEKLQKQIKNLKEKIKNNDEVKKLREENASLKTNLDELDSQHQVAMEKLLTLKKGLQKNFEMLKEEYEELQSANASYAKEIEGLKKCIQDKDLSEVAVSKAEHETLHHKYVNLEKVHMLLQETAEKFQEENQELNEENFKLQEELSKLQHDLEMLQEDGSNETVAKDKYDKVLFELTKLQENRSCRNDVQLDESNIDDNAKSVIENLKREIGDLKSRLSDMEGTSDSVNADSNKNIDESILESLLEKYVTFALPSSTQSNVNVLSKIETAFKMLNSSKKDIATLEHQLSEKTLQINHMQTQIDDLTSENEFLTSDLSHFEREMTEMKKNNDFLISEIASLKNTSKLVPISESNEDNLVKLESELEDCNRQKNNFETEIKVIREQLSHVTNEREIMKSDLDDIKNKYKALMTELETYKSKMSTLQDLENASEVEINDKIKQIIDESETLKSKLNLALANNEQLILEKTILENEKVIIMKEVDDLKKDHQKKTDMYNEINAKKITLEHKISELDKRLNEFLKDKVEMEHEKLHFTEKLKALCSESGDSTVSIDEYLSKLESKLKTILEKDRLIQQVRDENAECKKLQAKLMADNSELFEKLSLAARQYEEKETALNQQIESLKTQQKDCNQTDFEQEITALKQKLSKFEDITSESELLRQDKLVLIETRTILEKELGAAASKINDLEASASQLSSEIIKKDETIQSFKEEIIKNNETINKLNNDLDDLNKTICMKDSDIMKLNNELTEMSKSLSEKHAKITDLTKTIDEITTVSISNNATIDDLNEKSEIIAQKDREINELKQQISDLEATVEEKISLMLNNLKSDCEESRKQLEQVNKEKNDLINLVTLKHNESLQYHAEIQRLNQVIHDNTSQYQQVLAECDVLRKNNEVCSSCEVMKQKINERDSQIIELSKNIDVYESKLSEISSSTELINNLSDKCESLDKTLTIQLNVVKQLTAENSQLKEQDYQSKKELERLRQHLVEIEESYTQELMASEKRISEHQQKLQNIEERAKQTSTLFTSKSIRANQEVETLRNQISLLERQRDEYQSRLSAAEDEQNKSRAALTNLQVVLEQFQLDKEKDIELATDKIRRVLRDAEQRNLDLKVEIQRLNSKIEESVAGLKAASRLGDQLEIKTAQIVDLKEQVHNLQMSVTSAEERYKNVTSNQQDKVEKSLVKNLLINYINAQTKPNDRNQVLKILSTVLDLNQKECERIGLAKPQQTNQNTESLATEFVRFLEKESARPNLPNMMAITSIGPNRSSTPSSRKNSGLGPPPPDYGHKRQTSSGSNNLLFQNTEAMPEDLEGPINFQITSQTPDLIRPTAILNLDNSGVNQTRNTEGAILKNVLRDIEN